MRSRLRREIIEREPEKNEFWLGITKRILADIGVKETINASIKWDEQQSEVSLADLSSALILTMFFECHKTLRMPKTD